MIDLYVDDMTLTKIRDEKSEHVLTFVNNEKDESLHMPINDKELLNILFKVGLCCESLDLIYSAKFKLKER